MHYYMHVTCAEMESGTGRFSVPLKLPPCTVGFVLFQPSFTSLDGIEAVAPAVNRQP